MFRYRRTWWRSAILWACVLSGGAGVGAAGVMMIELRIVHSMREGVAELGWFDRWAGKVLFKWRPVDEKVAFAISELPEESLERTERAAWLIGLSGLALAGLGPALLRWRWRP